MLYDSMTDVEHEKMLHKSRQNTPKLKEVIKHFLWWLVSVMGILFVISVEA